MDSNKVFPDSGPEYTFLSSSGSDSICFGTPAWPSSHYRQMDQNATDMVNNPPHYKKAKYEAIEVIEDAISDAPTTKIGFLQAQVLKYLLRIWGKNNPKQDAQKARWYLNRLIDSLN
jgi:hypothetical protein